MPVHVSSCLHKSIAEVTEGMKKVLCFKNVRVVGEEDERKVSYDVHVENQLI